MHPFEAAREYTRALNAVKLDKVFAKPFIGSLDGHRDGVSCINQHPKRLSLLISGAFDGEVRLWDVALKVCLRDFTAHEGIIRGIAVSPSGDHFITVGDDKNIKMWKTDPLQEDDESPNTILSKTILTGT